ATAVTPRPTRQARSPPVVPAVTAARAAPAISSLLAVMVALAVTLPPTKTVAWQTAATAATAASSSAAAAVTVAPVVPPPPTGIPARRPVATAAREATFLSATPVTVAPAGPPRPTGVSARPPAATGATAAALLASTAATAAMVVMAGPPRPTGVSARPPAATAVSPLAPSTTRTAVSVVTAALAVTATLPGCPVRARAAMAAPAATVPVPAPTRKVPAVPAEQVPAPAATGPPAATAIFLSVGAPGRNTRAISGEQLVLFLPLVFGWRSSAGEPSPVTGWCRAPANPLRCDRQGEDRFARRRSFAGLGYPEPLVQPAHRRRRPPVVSAEQVHEGRHQHHPDDRGVGKHGQRQPETEHPHDRHLGRHQRRERNGHQHSRGGDHPAGTSDAERNGFIVVDASLSGGEPVLADAGYQEHLV